MDDLEKLANDFLAVKEQINALEQTAGAIREEIDAKVAARRTEDPTISKWLFDGSTVVYVAPSERASIDRALLVQNGVSAEILERSTVKKTVKGYTKVEVRK